MKKTFLFASMLLLAACDGAPVSEPIPKPALAPGQFIISNPSMATFTANGILASTLGARVAYVSLPPGTIPGGVSAVLHARGGELIRVDLIEGGFDPIAITANAGDTIAVTVTSASASPVLFQFTVPVNAKPRLVRTNPAPHKKDVPLNARPVGVFSEPLSSSALNGSNVQVRKGNVPVAGELFFGDSSRTQIVFVPAKPLDPAADYNLYYSQSISDLDGATLDSLEIVPFTTSSSAVASAEFFITNTLPDNGSFVPGYAATPEVWFNDRIDVRSLQGPQPRLQLFLGQDTVSGDVVCQNLRELSCASIRFVPKVPMLPGTPYRFEVLPGLQGVNGATLTTGATIRFTTGSTIVGASSTAISIVSFTMIELGEWAYAPLVRIKEIGGQAASHIKIVFLSGGSAPWGSLCMQNTLLAGQTLELFTEIYGDYQIVLGGSLAAHLLGEFTVQIYYSDAKGGVGMVTATTRATPGSMPTTYTGGVPPTSYEGCT